MEAFIEKFSRKYNLPAADCLRLIGLMERRVFRKAYLEDGMTREQFITFGSANRTTDQFINDGWNPLINFKF